MKYKKKSIAVISILCLLSACNANDVSPETTKEGESLEKTSLITETEEHLEDGQYFAEAGQYTSNWRDIVDVEVVNGNIKTITFNAVNEVATEYKRNKPNLEEKSEVTESNPDNDWETQLQLLENYLVKNQDSILELTKENMPSIEGVTLDAFPLVELLQQALTAGPLETGAYQDGQYFASLEDENHQIKHTINLLVHRGYIIAAHWDTTLPSDLKLTEEEQSYITQWNEQANLLEQHLIKYQDPTQITFNEENKTSDVSGVTIEVYQFIELATKALASGPLLD